MNGEHESRIAGLIELGVRTYCCWSETSVCIRGHYFRLHNLIWNLRLRVQMEVRPIEKNYTTAREVM